MTVTEGYLYAKEYWTGDSRDGNLVNRDGYHYYYMSSVGEIYEAFEVYEKDDGDVVVTPLPEMKGVGWKKDLGFDSYDNLEMIDSDEYEYVKDLYKEQVESARK